FLRAEGDFLNGIVGVLELNDLNLVGGNAFDASLPSSNGATSQATQDGGAVLVGQTDLFTSRVRSLNNQSAQDGGAVGFEHNVTVFRNRGGDAAISAILGTVNLQFSTVTNNQATFGIATGGGIHTSTLVTSNSVIARNINVDNGSGIQDIQADNIISNGFNFV